MTERLVIVVPSDQESAIRKRILDIAAWGWEASVRLVGASTRGAKHADRVAAASKILDIVDEFNASSLIVAKEVVYERSVIEQHQDLDFRALHFRVLRDRVVPRELESRKLLWRKVVDERLGLWSSTTCNAEEWLGQFGALGARGLGEVLLRQVEVISHNDVVHAIQASAAGLGPDVIFTFMAESDPAASANWMGGVLTRMYGTANAKDFVGALAEAKTGSHLVVCEDGLWTGTELRRRLGLLSDRGELGPVAKDKRISFHYAVLTDFGLAIARHFIEHAGLDAVDLLQDHTQRRVRVLRTSLTEDEIRSKHHLSPEEFEDWLTTQVQPLAFQNDGLWAGRHDEARRLCIEIGTQLIDKYAQDEYKRWREPVKLGFALGAGGIGSTLVFGHSIPKVCLPILWLAGPVRIGSVSLNWKPLFHDGRRVKRISSEPIG
jgi:hypothetical protein